MCCTFYYSGLVFCLCDGRPFNPFICFTDSALLLCGECVRDVICLCDEFILSCLRD